MDPGGDACANAEFLLQILDEITESILMSAEACPKSVNKASSFLNAEMRCKLDSDLVFVGQLGIFAVVYKGR